MTTIKKISFVALFTAMFMTAIFMVANTAFAQTTGGGGTGCIDCGGSTGGQTGGSTGGSTSGGGGSTPARPTCDISTSISSVNAGGTYTITWKVGSTAAVNVYINDYKVSQNGSATYTFNNSNLVEDFTLRANNAGGNCTDFVEVKKVVVAPVCNIDTNISVAAIGEAYTVTWNGTPAAASFKINGSPVPDSGSKAFTFTGPNKDEFTMTGDNQGQTCSKKVVVTVKTTTPTPQCIDFAANPATINEGESTTLNWTTKNATKLAINNGVGVVTGTSYGPVTPLTSTIYVLTVFGADNKKVTCEAPVTVIPKTTTLAPTCDSLTATPATINEGDSSVLAWTTTNATTVTLNGTAVAVDGNRTVTPAATKTYTIVAKKAGYADASCVKTVTVVPKTTPVPPTCDSFTATPETINEGDASVLSWTTTNATQVTLNGNIVAEDGTQTVTPVVTKTYTIVAKKAGYADASCVKTITVIPDVVDLKPECKLFAATPSALGVGGGNVTLNWEVLRATSVVIDNGVGTNLALTGSKVVNVTQSKTFTLTATDADGDSVSCLAPVAVADPAVFTCANNVSFSANDTSITRGDTITLNWAVSGADTVAITNLGTVAATGNQNVSPTSDITYYLTATKAGYTSLSCPLSINVSTGGGGGGGTPTPSCDLEISDSKIESGDKVTIKWDTRNATEVTLKDDKGKILFTTDKYLSNDKRKYYDYEIDVKPTRNTTYTLIAERGSKDRECKVSVKVEGDDLVVLETRFQAPLVSGISLSQVPYTGFEAGPVMTILFYMLLVAWALYITYVMVIPKTSLAVASVARLDNTPEGLMSHAESVRPDVFAALPTTSVAPVATPMNLPVAEVAPVAAPVITDVTTAIENLAHQQQALISSDAVRTIADMTTEENRVAVVNKIVADAKGAFALEDGWVVINQSRLSEITATPTAAVATTPTGAGSLAEAIVTGNIVAAYEMIGGRPMIALADAAADLDAVYRNRKGEANQVSDMLTVETAALTNDQISQMIAALTGALDGTYTDEAAAVKMAIMKAVKVAA